MISTMRTALSGITAFMTQLNVSANNLANVNTDGFKRSETTFVETSSGGVFPLIQQDNSPGPTIFRNMPHDLASVELSNVDIGRELVSQIIAQKGIEANLQTMKTADDMVGSLLNLRK